MVPWEALLGLDDSLGDHFHVEILFTITTICFVGHHLYLVSKFILNVCIDEYK